MAPTEVSIVVSLSVLCGEERGGHDEGECVSAPVELPIRILTLNITLMIQHF